MPMTTTSRYTAPALRLIARSVAMSGTRTGSEGGQPERYEKHRPGVTARSRVGQLASQAQAPPVIPASRAARYPQRSWTSYDCCDRWKNSSTNWSAGWCSIRGCSGG
ncbi:hypothetical protein BN1263520139 [Stenotrophomonas indicatrix]|nr:hypothetical protein BN1263520139 [Stenotrophomonas indicatrix]